VTGTWINALAILLGTGFAIVSQKDISAVVQQRIKLALAVFAMFVGVSLLWESTHGGVLRHLKQFALLFVALIAGNLIGMLLGIQKALNQLALFAKEQFTNPAKSNGFKLTSALFCLTPLAVIGGMIEGLIGDYSILLIKATMDGIAAHSFYRLFGKSVLLSAIPLVAFQGNLTLLFHWVASGGIGQHAIQGIIGISGLLVFTSVLLITNTGKPRIADYLPAMLVIVPLAHWFW
jgi:uncharacterized protein